MFVSSVKWLCCTLVLLGVMRLCFLIIAHNQSYLVVNT